MSGHRRVDARCRQLRSPDRVEGGSIFVGVGSWYDSVSRFVSRDGFHCSDTLRAKLQRSSIEHEAITAAQQLSLVRREFERAACRSGSAVVSPRSKFHPAVYDPKIQPMDEAAIAALLAKILHPRPRPLAIRDDIVADALGHRRQLKPSK
jgi:hypothetical protein